MRPIDRETLAWCLRQGETAYQKIVTQSPDFLVISPPKTGSTWLADNLRCHPDLFVSKVKELKYFSSYYKWLDLNWYLDHFTGGVGRIKGEASPSYASLPLERIKLIRQLLPDVKLIYLMRDPVSRAWSHARHNFRYREANFAGCTADIGAIPDSQWEQNFHHDWPLVSGDYLGQLRRWLSVFPREQVYVGFFESIAGRPRKLLCDIFAFLGVRNDVDLTGFPVADRILPGVDMGLSVPLRRSLQRLLHDRTCQLAALLQERFCLSLPAEWQWTFERAEDMTEPEQPAAFRQADDDGYLTRVLEQEETFPSSWPHLVVPCYRGFSLVYYRNCLYALDHALGHIDLTVMSVADLEQHQRAGRCFQASTFAELSAHVDQELFHRQVTEQRQAVRGLQGELREAQAHIARLQESLNIALGQLNRAENAIERLTPWHIKAGRLMKRVGKRFAKGS